METQDDKFGLYIDSIGQSELARRMGVSRQAVWKWRRQVDTPSTAMARQLVRQSGGFLTLDDVIGE